MTFRRLSANTIPATTIEAAQARARSLYREWLREVPRSVLKFPLDIPISLGRARIRAEFEKHRFERDLDVLNVLVLKGTQELIEVHNKWKQRVHVMRYFDDPQWNPLGQVAKQPLVPNSLGTKSAFLAGFLGK